MNEQQKGERLRDMLAGARAERQQEQQRVAQQQHVEQQRVEQAIEHEGGKSARKRAGRRRRGALPTAMFKRSTLGALAVRFLQALAWALIALSVAGTFYTFSGADAPITKGAWGFVTGTFTAMLSKPEQLVLALVSQAIMSIVQFGASSNAFAAARDGDGRKAFGWIVVYLVFLTPSVYCNWDAYGAELIKLGLGAIVAFLLLVAFDVVPEVVLNEDD